MARASFHMLLSIAVLFLIRPQLGASQDSLSLRVVSRLKSPQISRWSRVLAVPPGYAVAPIEGGGVQLFSLEGKVLWTSLRSKASEDWNISLQARGDTILVFDPGRERLLRLGLDGLLLGSERLPRGTSYRMLPNGDVAFTANRRTSESFGHPWHVYSEDHELRSYGFRGNVVSLYQDVWALEWKLAKGESATVWTHFRDRFRAEEWHAGGPHAGEPTGRVLQAAPPWLTIAEADQPTPRPFLHAALFEAGILWTLGHSLQAGWGDSLSENWTGGLLSVPQNRAVYDTIVEAWSVEGGSKLGRGRIDVKVLGFAAPGLVFSIEEGADGLEAVLWRIEGIQHK